MDARSRPSGAAPVSASLCPGCGTAIDPLRAGHVAILEGGFRYFCGAGCKASFVDVTSRRASLDAMTADPPGVTSGTRVRDEIVSRALSSSTPASSAVAPVTGAAPAAFPSFPSPPTPPPPAPPIAEDSPGEAAAEAPAGEEAAVDLPEASGPSTLRSPRVASEPPVSSASASAPPSRAPAASSPALVPAAPGDLRAGAWRLAPLVGIGLGVVAAVVGLAGEAAASMRAPLALVAAALAIVHATLRSREPCEGRPWLVAGPVALGAAALMVAIATDDARRDSHATYLGLAAAATLLVELLVARSGRDVAAARARVASALAVRVRVVRGEDTLELEASQVRAGEQVVVTTGDVIGVDGLISAGEGEVAPWHDSPVVLAKREGDAVVAGATVVSGRLRINATFTGAERAWLRLAHSSGARIDVAAPVVALARRVVERSAPVACAAAAAAAYASGGSWADVVVAASAGAFAMAGVSAVSAVGLAHARGHLAAQRRGIVYKDGAAFDAAARTEVAVVCSRGTIVLGAPELVAVETVNGKSKTSEVEETERVLSLAAGAEMASDDAVAGAVLRAARSRGVRPETLRSALVHAGLGITALSSTGDKVIVGSRAFVLQEKVSVAIADARTSELEAQGRSVLLVAVAGRVIGLVALQDGLRPGARAAVQRLHDARIEPVFLSGEARDTCETIARALDIEHVRPEILPADRGAEVRALADGGRIVASVGHPASDDGALGAADVAVAMSAAGAAPGEWAVALASDDVRDAALALTVPRACRDRARTAAVVAAGAQGLTLVAIGFGAAPAVCAPVVAALVAVFVLATVREPTTLGGRPG